MKFLVLLIFILSIKANQNYQQRTIYYGEHDNVCKIGQTADTLNFTVIFDETYTYNEIHRSTLGCNDWMPYYWMQLQPSTGWEIIVQKDGHDFAQMIFKDSTVWTYKLKELVEVRSKATIERVEFDNEDKYNCTIIGDKISHHFGNAPILVKCNKQRVNQLVTQ